ncbi:hypothetical protein TcBrA4_0100050 [Trypanosoma cruzi]|nr:hypothetical protein TcBrA4_0100050 [Trypanosoma cruzi]
MMVAGWIAGEVLSQALGNREWVKNRTSFLTSLYNQRRYVVDDIVIGDYGGECKVRLRRRAPRASATRAAGLYT